VAPAPAQRHRQEVALQPAILPLMNGFKPSGDCRAPTPGTDNQPATQNGNDGFSIRVTTRILGATDRGFAASE
jgi:hypothetical protein